jgi:predicted metal-dependent phosphoesterase TrpH
VVDLHTHSTVSDGSDPPERLPELAAAAGCGALALTDHDRTDGVHAARARAHQLGVELVAGCEVSCAGSPGSLHVLVYFVEEGEGPLHEELARLQRDRADRNRQLLARLGELGIQVSQDELAEQAGTGDLSQLGRPHVAAVLVRKGLVTTVQEAFDQWLGRGRPAYVSKARVGPLEVARLARASGAVAVLAHPWSTGLDQVELKRAVSELAEGGFGGLEAYYGRYCPEERAALAALAGELDLVATGGSDYHGFYKPDLKVGVGTGDLEVPDQALEALAARRPGR